MAVKVGIIGCGYWGPNLIRNFISDEGSEVVCCCDRDPERLKAVQTQYPHMDCCSGADDVFQNGDIDAAVIATPISTHFDLASRALANGKHVLLEKPMTTSVDEAEILIQESEKNGLVLMVDHTFLYSGAVSRIKEIVDSGEIGDILYIDSVRVNLGLFQHDINVLWDLAPHDFSILNYIVDEEPSSIDAVGASHIAYSSTPIENIVYVTVQYGEKKIAHFHFNWLSPVKIRRTLIGGSRKMIVYDHLDPDNQVKIYDKGVDVKDKEDIYTALIQYRTGDMRAPKIDQTEPLKKMAHHFLECIETGSAPLTDGQNGLKVVRLLEQSQKTLSLT